MHAQYLFMTFIIYNGSMFDFIMLIRKDQQTTKQASKCRKKSELLT